jgi:two-component system OmpR family sensor kinase
VQLRDDFLSVAGHELRTPLTALQLHLQSAVRMLTRGAPDAGERARARVESAALMTERLGTLVGALLDVSRLSAGAARLDREPFELGQLVHEVAARFGVQSERVGSRLEVDAEPGLVGDWDHARLDQVLTNLLGNAVKYGAGAPIAVEAKRSEAGVRVVVRDGGIGIAPVDQQRVFERFERAVSDRNYGGLGIGLWVSKQLVEAHGGRIGVDSAPGQGSSFWVELPLGAPASPA